MQNTKVTNWAEIWAAASKKVAIQTQEEEIAQLKANNPEAFAQFLADWDEAIAADKRITAFRNRTEEEKEEYRKACKRNVEDNRWKGAVERTETQLIEDGRKRYQADMPLLYHFGMYD